jgi:hypothetical protein
VLRRLLEAGGGWQITMLDDVPWFVPPAWLDAEQKPLRNVRP